MSETPSGIDYAAPDAPSSVTAAFFGEPAEGNLDVHEGMNEIQRQQWGPEVATTLTSDTFSRRGLTPSGHDYTQGGSVTETMFGRPGDGEPAEAGEYEDDDSDVDDWADDLGSILDEQEYELPDGSTVTASEWQAREQGLAQLAELHEQLRMNRYLQDVAAMPGGEEMIQQVQERRELAASVAEQLQPMLEPLRRAEARLAQEDALVEAEAEAFDVIAQHVPEELDDDWRRATLTTAEALYPLALDVCESPRAAAQAALEVAADEAVRMWEEVNHPKSGTEAFSRWYAAHTAGRPTSVTARWRQDGLFS